MKNVTGIYRNISIRLNCAIVAPILFRLRNASEDSPVTQEFPLTCPMKNGQSTGRLYAAWFTGVNVPFFQRRSYSTGLMLPRLECLRRGL